MCIAFKDVISNDTALNLSGVNTVYAYVTLYGKSN